jgi:alkylhydroperoxidase/carboxymuconolactone decarboxylase family protein YurZ
MTTDGRRLLDEIRTERGYTLSFHEILARVDADYLAAYRDFYRAITLRERVLTPVQREIIWICLLVAVREEVGTIHVERARDAGIPESGIAACIRLAAVADAWESLQFAADHWSWLVEDTSTVGYLELVASTSQDLDPVAVELALLAAHAGRRRKQPFDLHLRRLLEQGVSEAAIVEAITYVQQPCGANTLLWATDAWLDAIAAGTLPPGSGLLDDVTNDTRRR